MEQRNSRNNNFNNFNNSDLSDEGVSSSTTHRLRKRLPIQQAPYSIERIRARKAGIPTEIDEKVLRKERELENDKQRYNYELQEDGFVVRNSDEEQEESYSIDNNLPKTVLNKRQRYEVSSIGSIHSDDEPISQDKPKSPSSRKKPRTEVKRQKQFINPDLIKPDNVVVEIICKRFNESIEPTEPTEFDEDSNNESFVEMDNSKSIQSISSNPSISSSDSILTTSEDLEEDNIYDHSLGESDILVIEENEFRIRNEFNERNIHPLHSSSMQRNNENHRIIGREVPNTSSIRHNNDYNRLIGFTSSIERDIPSIPSIRHNNDNDEIIRNSNDRNRIVRTKSSNERSLLTPLIRRNGNHKNRKIERIERETPFDQRLKFNLQWAKEMSIPSIDNPLFKEYTSRWSELFNQLAFAVPLNQPWPPEAIEVIKNLILQFKSMKPNNSNIEEPYKLLCSLIKTFPRVKNNLGEIRDKKDYLSIPSMVEVFYSLTNKIVQSITDITPKKFLREFQIKNFHHFKELFKALDNKTTSYYQDSHEKLALILGDFLKMLSPRDNIAMLNETLDMFNISTKRFNTVSEPTKKGLINLHRILVNKFYESAEDETDLRLKIKACLRAIKWKVTTKAQN
ncbi:5701_t:CDS:2 [Diversispora eburnea]|uniref:5701_t:CDS:1 n=1 Tax=Diversispora eburnea TaxID=1213867 RepID=A0A9N8YLX1_9GLOM|nr:5701_t:CDS:2 [Diversispora eburnea]